MKERIRETFSGKSGLVVYPHLKPDADDRLTAACGHVETLHWFDAKENIWKSGININIGYSKPMTREQSNELIAAINRCWQWIEEQGK